MQKLMDCIENQFTWAELTFLKKFNLKIEVQFKNWTFSSCLFSAIGLYTTRNCEMYRVHIKTIVTNRTEQFY